MINSKNLKVGSKLRYKEIIHFDILLYSYLFCIKSINPSITVFAILGTVVMVPLSALFASCRSLTVFLFATNRAVVSLNNKLHLLVGGCDMKSFNLFI